MHMDVRRAYSGPGSRNGHEGSSDSGGNFDSPLDNYAQQSSVENEREKDLGSTAESGFVTVEYDNSLH